MSLSIGIVGLPNVGKSTLFNVLTKSNILAANYPFATIEPNSGIVPVTDPRLDKLAEIYQTEKIIPATIEFIDIAGLVAGASKGEGLGNQFLANIRECDAIIHLVRAFDDPNVQHTSTEVNPQADIDIINTELILADMTTIEKHLPKLTKEVKANSKLKPKLDLLNQIYAELEAGKPINNQAVDSELISDLNLLTAKATIYLFNVDEQDLTDQAKLDQLAALAPGNQSLAIAIKMEDELKDMDEAEAAELLASYGVDQGGLAKLVTAAYNVLGLQSFLTAGAKEVRAWTIRQGATAPEAAGAIHTDFQTGFIAAQVIDYHDLAELGSEAAAKAAGKIRTEGKTYIMQPDDVVEFRFNV